jgi:hypothetical protein
VATEVAVAVRGRQVVVVAVAAEDNPNLMNPTYSLQLTGATSYSFLIFQLVYD